MKVYSGLVSIHVLKKEIMKRLPIVLIMGGALFLMGYLMPEGAGFRIESSNNQYQAMAQGSLPGIFYGLAFGLLVFVLPRKEIIANAIKPVGVLRRLGAIYVNMFVILFILINLTVLPILLVEAMHTGEFQWSFYREFSRGTDGLVGGGSVLFIFGLIFYYYYKSLVNNRPTIGQYVMGYQIVNNGDAWTRRRALRRMGLTLLTLVAWPVTAIIAVRHEKKAFWFDLKTDSIAERFDYASEEKMLS